MSKSIFLFIPAIFIVLLLAAISSEYQLIPKSTQVTISPTSVPTGWIEITNQEKLFSFSAPKDWNFDGTVLRNYTDDQVKPKMGFPEKSVKCDFVLPSDSEPKIINQNPIKSQNGLRIIRGTVGNSTENWPGYGDYVVYEIDDGKGQSAQLICFAFEKTLSSTVDQILSTFKFIDQ